MEIVDFTHLDQKEAAAFLRSIYKEMGWIEYWDEGFDNLYNHFNLSEDGFFLLVKDDNKIIATAILQKLDKKVGIVKKFYVHKKYRGLGVAQNLLKSFIKKAEEIGVSKVVLDVVKSNIRAIKFYEKRGFRKYNQEPVNAWYESTRPGVFYYYYLNLY